MRIAFLGKGGAGKTTTAAGFIKYAAEKHPFVLAIDADVNAHMRQALGLEEEPRELGDCFDEISAYLRGGRTDLGNRPIISATPPSLNSSFIKVSKSDPFIQKYAIENKNISLLSVGTYNERDFGSACYHTKLSSLSIVFHHMLDTQNDIVIADTTAGTDNIATSLSFAYDLNIFVVEPTEKSIGVYSDFIRIAPQLYDCVFVIANKIDGEQDQAFINKHIPQEKLLGYIPFSKNLKRYEQGDKQALSEFQNEQTAAFETTYTQLKNVKRDWNKYLEQLRQTYSKVCQDWYNNYYGMKLDADLDSEFSYELVLNKVMAQDPSEQQLILV